MNKDGDTLFFAAKNFVFVGEAGSGKSELAINTALTLKEITDKEVHFFDLDQTKPLFRARDVRELLESSEIKFHYHEQLLDTPTMVGGVRERVSDNDSIVVIDTGGTRQGARMVGCFSEPLNRCDTRYSFVINPYRPWFGNLNSIDSAISEIIYAARIRKFTLISNPCVGKETSVSDVIEGSRKMKELIGKYINIDYISVMAELCSEVARYTETPLIPLKLYLNDMLV